MTFIRLPLILLLSILLLVSACHPSAPTVADKQNFYRDVLQQLIMDRYYYACMFEDGRMEKRYNDMIEHKVDRDVLEEFVDSLKEARKRIGPKCEVRYSNSNDIRSTIDTYGDSLTSDWFADGWFQGVLLKTINDTLSQGINLPVEDLSMPFLKIVPHQGSRFIGGGNNVISLSRAYFGDDGTKAVLYYDYACGGKCGVGKILFVAWESGGWRIVKMKDLWES
jgi:hypothetical protein